MRGFIRQTTLMFNSQIVAFVPLIRHTDRHSVGAVGQQHKRLCVVAVGLHAQTVFNRLYLEVPRIRCHNGVRVFVVDDGFQ